MRPHSRFRLPAGAAGGTLIDDLSARGTGSAQAQELLEQNLHRAAGGIRVAVFAVPEGERLDGQRAAVATALRQLAAADHVAGSGNRPGPVPVIDPALVSV